VERVLIKLQIETTEQSSDKNDFDIIHWIQITTNK